MTEEEIKILLERYAKDRCTPDEKKWVEAWLRHVEEQSDWSWSNREHLAEVKQRIAGKIEQSVSLRLRRRVPAYYRFAAIAACFLAVVTGIVFWQKAEQPQLQADHIIALPEQVDGARLTMSDGTEIDLGSLKGGGVSQTEAGIIKKGMDNSISYAYRSETEDRASEEQWNTLRIPPGASYHLLLPDGSKVWLNACSELSFPSAFGRASRKVILRGEAYFEVKQQAQQPFFVEANGTMIAVMGTAFNVSAYPDEKEVLTTLTDGAVAVSLAKQRVVLEPGEQARADRGGSHLSKSKVDSEIFVAWKNDYFVFDDLDIKSIMYQIARWYNTEVVFQGTIPTKKFGGTFSRTKPIEELLSHLERLGGLRFKLENGSYFKKGRRIVVMP
ncbi:FecR family protein [Olivibacter jilunii]|uniref:FecR family protein n=1 Tax=Olivibacter jilunii TaxID=985016 RepID=UPI003F157222